jgi:hypothetical protein
MSELAGIAKAVDGMKRDLDRLGDCKKMLASPSLYEALRELYIEGALNVGKQPPLNDTLYFKGAPVVECDHLQGMEYAFVK